MRRALCACLVLASGPVAADVTPANPDAIVEAIRAHGHKAKLAQTDAGVPYIDAEGGGFRYWVDFYNCEGGANCADIQFNATFEIAKQVPDVFLAQWARNWAIGAASAEDNGDARISHYVIMEGGISDEAMQATLEAWTGLLETFQTELYR